MITFDVTFDPGDQTSFLNSAIASADSLGGLTADTSANGSNSDSDGDGDPDEAGENDPTPINLILFEIPTLGAFGVAMLMLLLACIGSAILHRRSA